MRRITFVTVIILMIFINPVLGVSEKEMVNFFENYIKLSDHFDISVKNLYADDAKIHAYRRYPHGLERATLSGKNRWYTDKQAGANYEFMPGQAESQ